MELKEVFAHNLNTQLHRTNKNQLEISLLLGVSPAAVSAWCTGQKMPRMDKIEKLANYFEIRKSDLIEEKPTTVSGDGLWASICEDKTKLMLARWISSLNKDQLQMVVGLLEAARLTPEK